MAKSPKFRASAAEFGQMSGHLEWL